MQPASDGDAVLAQLSQSATVTSIGEVMQIMQNLDAVLPSTDGLKWFNLLYLSVTQAIDQQVHDLPPARDSLMRVMDRLTGFAGRGLLVPV